MEKYGEGENRGSTILKYLILYYYYLGKEPIRIAFGSATSRLAN